MKINVQTVANVIGVKSNHSEKTGKDYFNLSIEIDGECTNIPCTSDVAVFPFEKYSPYLLGLQYDDTYKFIRAVSIKEYKK